MPKLRDYFFSDLNTFINEDEFATEAIIEDEIVSVVIDNDKLAERQLNNHAEGLHTEELLFHVSKISLTFYPRPDNRVRVDGSLWNITDVQEDEGLFTITAKMVRA
ncbi:hypothetical protein ACJ2A9_21310 [Anaerobacillus sp. MEB173]|uniref:hypothetical protein n=1 Tax=Anaerobacillus sp. MEB173 TaxID=3383345 RepID=UPI003F91EA89